MRKERFPDYKRSNLQSKGDGPFQDIEWINNNTYNVKLRNEYDVNATFNIYNLSLFDVGDDLKLNSFENRGTDKNQEASPNDPLEISIGLITRSKVKKIKKALNGLI